MAVGAEKMTAIPAAEVSDILQTASYVPEEGEIPAGFAGVFGRIVEGYFQRYGDNSAELAMIAAKNHANAVLNPFAHLRKDMGFDFLQHRQRPQSARCRPAAAHRLFADLGRGGGGGHRHRRCRGLRAAGHRVSRARSGE